MGSDIWQETLHKAIADCIIAAGKAAEIEGKSGGNWDTAWERAEKNIVVCWDAVWAASHKEPTDSAWKATWKAGGDNWSKAWKIAYSAWETAYLPRTRN